MSLLRVYWNLVDAKVDVNIDMFARSQSQRLVSRVKNIGTKCRGVFFRSVLREELDFKGFLDSIRLEDVRKARRDPDNTLLFRPKKEQDKSIGVLRIVRPKRFSVAKQSQFFGVGGPGSLPSIAVPFETPTKEFEVLLESTEFILEDVQEQMAERFQLQETFGDFNVFFFGKRAEIYTYSGSLLNADGNLQWRNQFLDNYDRFLRGTKAAELKARVYLLYDDVIREGFILSAGIAQNSFTEGVVKFNFTMLITGKRILGQIPKNPTADPFETLAGTVDPRTGIEEFQFFRSLNPDLPGVRLSTTPGEALNNLIQNDSIPGTEAPSDLKQIMTTRSLNAMQRFFTVSDTLETLEAGLDHDILIDFIDSDTLSGLLTTSSIMTGKRTQDADNLEGGQLFAQLKSGVRTVNDLRLIEAVKVADEFSRFHKETIGADLSEKLLILSNRLQPNSSDRIIVPVGPTFDQEAIFKDRKYVLPQDRDKQRLETLVKETEALRDHQTDTTNELVLNAAKANILDVLFFDNVRRRQSEQLQLYVAAFLLLRNPSDSMLFEAVRTAYDGTEVLTTTKDPLDFIGGETIERLLQAGTNLPSQVSGQLTNALNDLEQSWIFDALAAEIGSPKNLMVLGEELLKKAAIPSPLAGFAGSAAQNSVDFIHRISILIGSVFAETEPGLTPQSTDTVAGSLKDPKGNVSKTYFTKAFHDEIAIGQNTEGDMVAASVNGLFGDFFERKSDFNGGYIVFPVGRPTGPFVIVKAGSGGAFSREEKLEISQISLDPVDKELFDVGYFRLDSDQRFKLFEPGNEFGQSVMYFKGVKRKAGLLVNGHIKNATADELNISSNNNFFTGQTTSKTVQIGTLGGLQTQTSIVRETFEKAFTMVGFAPKRSYQGGTPKDYQNTSTNKLRDLINFRIGSLIERVAPSIVSDAKAEIVRLTTNPTIRKNIDPDGKLIKAFGLENFIEIEEIVSVAAALFVTGVIAEDYFAFIFMAEEQKKLAIDLERLQDLLFDAVQAVTDGAGSRAEDVEESDKELRNIICQ